MQQDQFNEESFWDDLDDSDFEMCVLKENEFLTQNPSAQRKDVKSNLITEEGSNQWVNGSSNSFNTNTGAKLPTAAKTENRTPNKKINFATGSKEKKPSSGSNYSFNNSFVNISKKSNFYKPLDMGSSTSTYNACNTKTPLERREPFESLPDMKLVQSQLELALKDKAKLEEENLLKQGEVSNLRYELKRKETCLETERVDQCIALEAAEKRGKAKASKITAEMEQKVKTLGKEVDKLQGNLTFKTREVDELVSRCKILEQKSCDESSPSPKRRKVDSKVSPFKASNFAGRFDFGDVKKVTKNAQIQTESEKKINKRIPVKVHSKRGRSSGTRRVFHLLSSSPQPTGTPQSKPGGGERQEKEEEKEEKWSREHEHEHASLLSRMILAESSPSEAEHRLGQGACLDLETALKGEAANRGDMVAKIRLLSAAHPGSENASHNALRILSQCLQLFLEDGASKCLAAVTSALEALSARATQCANIPPDVCEAVIEALRKCCRVSAQAVIRAFLVALNSLLSFDSFKHRMCVNKAASSSSVDSCFVKDVCASLHALPPASWTSEMTNDVLRLVSALLLRPRPQPHPPRECACFSSLLIAFVNHLFAASQLLAEPKSWFPVLNGVKVLHFWQSQDKTWWTKALQLNSYTALLSTVDRKSKYLRAEGVLDQHTSELLYDLYDLDE